MKKSKLTFNTLGFLFIVGVLSGHSAMSQSTLVNVPSTDVVPQKNVYLEFDFSTNYAWERKGAFQTYVPRGVVGLGHDLEAGVNVAYTHLSGVSQPIEVQPNIKWRFFKNEKHGVAASAECILYAPITHRAGNDTFGLCYLVFSKKVNGHYGPR